MKVPAEINTTVYVDVDPREMIEQLPWEFDTPDELRRVLDMLNRCAACINAVSDDVIKKMHPNQRARTAEYLKAQVIRFLPKEKTAEERKLETDQAMKDPKVGDRFHEMFSYWVYIVAVGQGDVHIIEGNCHPSEFPDKGGMMKLTREDFINKYSYGTIPGYWVDLCDRGNDVSGWYQGKMKELEASSA